MESPVTRFVRDVRSGKLPQHPGGEILVAIVEAGIDDSGKGYLERVDSFTANLAGGTGSEMVERAKTLVAARGYRVMHGPDGDSEGGCCEYVDSAPGDCIFITVYPPADPQETQGEGVIIP